MEGVIATLGNVPKDAAVATLKMVAWENLDGTFTNWTMASLAWSSGFLRLGFSEKFNLSGIGGDLNSSPPLIGLQSFNVIGWFICPAPIINSQPQSRLAVRGQTVSFSVGASASGPGELRYLWAFNNSIIPGASTDQLVITNVSAQNQGSYRAVVAGYSSPSTVSSNVMLTVIPAAPELRAGPGYGGLEPDGFHFTLLSDPGLPCDLERSTNLLNWEGFLAVTNISGEIRLADPGAGSTPCNFYRAVGRA